MIVNYLVFIIILFFLSFYVKEQFVEIEYVKSSYDNKKYLVRNESDKKEAARILSIINSKLLELIEVLKKKYPEDERTKRVVKNYNPKAISEGSEDKKYTSYSINKGEKIVFCLRLHTLFLY